MALNPQQESLSSLADKQENAYAKSKEEQERQNLKVVKKFQRIGNAEYEAEKAVLEKKATSAPITPSCYRQRSTASWYPGGYPYLPGSGWRRPTRWAVSTHTEPATDKDRQLLGIQEERLIFQETNFNNGILEISSCLFV